MEDQIIEGRQRIREPRTTVFTKELAQNVRVWGQEIPDEALLIRVAHAVAKGTSDSESVDNFIRGLNEHNVTPQELGIFAQKLQSIVQKKALRVSTVGDLREKEPQDLVKAQGVGPDMARFIHTAFEIQKSDVV